MATNSLNSFFENFEKEANESLKKEEKVQEEVLINKTHEPPMHNIAQEQENQSIPRKTGGIKLKINVQKEQTQQDLPEIKELHAEGSTLNIKRQDSNQIHKTPKVENTQSIQSDYFDMFATAKPIKINRSNTQQIDKEQKQQASPIHKIQEKSDSEVKLNVAGRPIKTSKKMDKQKETLVEQPNKIQQEASQEHWEPFDPRDNRLYTERDLHNPLYNSKEREYVKNRISQQEIEAKLAQTLNENKQIEKQEKRDAVEELFVQSETPEQYRGKWMELYNAAINSTKNNAMQRKLAAGHFRFNEDGSKEILPDMNIYGMSSKQVFNQDWQI